LYPIKEWEAADLEQPFSEKEVKEAIFNIANDKAPGPNGFPVLFFQEFWDTLKGDVMNMFSDLYNGSLDLERLNYAHVVLISKEEGASTVSKFRTISLYIRLLPKF